MEQKPLVSIIIPTYRRPEKLDHAIKSAVAQTYKNTEIIVVDDNSNDLTMRKNTQKIVSKYPQIKLIAPNKNLGGGETRNVGIKSATGEFIAFLDDDDEFLPTKIEKQIKMYEQKNIEHKKIGLIYCYEYSKKYNSNKCKIIKKDHEGNALFEHLCFFTMPTSTWLCPKSVLNEVGGFDNIKSQQDLMLLMRMLAAGYEIFRVPEPLVLFNVHAPGDGISKHGDDFIKQVKHYNDECRKNYTSLSNYKKGLVDYSFSHRLFNCYLNAKEYNAARDELIKMIKTKPLRKRTIESCIKWVIK